MSEWEPGRWWRAVGPDGDVWCESSDEDEVRGEARPGDRIQRYWTRTESEWRDATEQTHRAIIDASNWQTCSCDRGEDHRLTYRPALRDWA